MNMAVAAACRICMSQELNTMELFKSCSLEIIRMIEFCTGVLLKKQEGLPSQMCSKCLADLQIAHKFKIKCLDSQKAFQEMTKLNCKDIKNASVFQISHNFIKLESMPDYKASNNSAEVRDDIKKSSRVLIRKSKLSLKKEKKVAPRRSKVASSDIKINSRRSHNKTKKLYCELCQLAFSNRKESLEHKNRLHKEEKSWICEVCGKSYAHRSSQIAHMHSHYPARFSCHDCDYSTYNKYDLVKHVRIHTGDKTYKCEQCPAAYRTSSNLRTHVRLMHERTRAHACHICGKTYNDRATLNRHIDAHNDIKRHVCEVCHSCFTRRCYWKKHLQKQHDIIIPTCRPGRPKAEILIERSNGLK